MDHRMLSTAVAAVVLLTVQANAQTSQIEFPATMATSFVRITAFAHDAASKATPITFAGKLGPRTRNWYSTTLTSASINTHECRTISFDVDLRTLVQQARPHTWEGLKTMISLIDARTGDTLSGCTRAADANPIELAKVGSDAVSTMHFIVEVPTNAPSTVQLRLAVLSFLPYRSPILTTITTGDVPHPATGIN